MPNSQQLKTKLSPHIPHREIRKATGRVCHIGFSLWWSLEGETAQRPVSPGDSKVHSLTAPPKVSGLGGVDKCR